MFLLLSSHSAYACYDKKPNDKANFESCLYKARQGDTQAQNNVGVMYKLGDGVTQDYKQAVKWYRKAAEQGFAEAQYNLGEMYAVNQDYKQALKWLTKAAEQGIAHAQNNLGLMYREGQGVTQDYKQAVKWYRKAAEQGLAVAEGNLGDMYFNGNGVTQDYKQALKWLTKAAEQGRAEAHYKLGYFYGAGLLGFPVDREMAHMWFNIAASSGYKDAKKFRDLFAKEMSPSQIEKAQDMARKWTAKHQD